MSAPPSQVWDAVIDPQLRGRWLGVALDVAPLAGARGRAVDERGDDRAVTVEAVEPGRFAFVWDAPGKSRHGPSRVVIAVTEEGGGTRLTVTETALADLDAELAGAEA